MVNTYEDVVGWIGDESTRLFDIAINNTDNDGIFVEIGTYRGKSSICMYDKIVESGKSISLYTIDNWSLILPHDLPGDDNRSIFLNNKGTREIRLIDGSWQSNYTLFEDNSIDFLFIDSNEVQLDLTNCIDSWLSKMKAGSIISGHDYHWDEIRTVVDIKFPNAEIIVEDRINVAEFDYQPETWSHHAWYCRL